MKLDYFLGHKFKPRKLWWDFTMDKSVWSSWMQRLAQRPEEVSEAFQSLGLAERELQKHAVIEAAAIRSESVFTRRYRIQG